jgi:TATA element modulatory factor
LKSQSQSQTFQETIQSLEVRLADQESKFTREKESLQEAFEIALDARLKEEKTKWEEDQQSLYTPVPFSESFPQISSPINSRPSPRNHKSSSPQPELNIKPRGTYPTRATSYGDISHLRRPSRHLPSPFDAVPPTLTPNQQIANLDDDEREFLNTPRADSPRNAAFDTVSMSASTSTAGPSVNIMERMSAAVRRLESDLVATKEELSRSIKQRDEAREECVKLMSEVEEKRRFQDAVQQSQTQYAELEVRYNPSIQRFNGRYNEALILLGEKSERVEELQMDIVDLKEGYQHALQRLVGGN